jgi:hypothetical protein
VWNMETTRPRHLDPTAKSSFDLRYERAVEHLDRLEGSIKRWLKQDAYTITDKLDSNTGKNVVKVRPKDPVPAYWGPWIGEILHNLRSSLDHLVFDLGTAYYGMLPPDLARTSAFPVYAKQAPDVRGFFEKVGCLDPCVQAFIEGLQPHPGGEAYVNDRLFILNELGNLDKHREPR